IPFLYLQNSVFWLNRPHISHSFVFSFKDKSLTVLIGFRSSVVFRFSTPDVVETSDGLKSDLISTSEELSLCVFRKFSWKDVHSSSSEVSPETIFPPSSVVLGEKSVGFQCDCTLCQT